MYSGCTKGSGGYGNNVFLEAGGPNTTRIRADRGTDDSGERTSMAQGIEDCVNEADSAVPTNFSATRSGNTVTIRAPTSYGALMNGRALTIVLGGTNGSFTTTLFSGGVSSGVVTRVSKPMRMKS